ncbi:hypothetical protein [Thioalkalivibrio sp. ALM2T]|uniref:hypothetical protein n=1 Tax=Thioalkalivibrio sp. ALM2T TaxID=1158184 RepID=UPI00036A66F2|nr:hypothetical protein [Thioalkalivibrio sp. ALM2T]
MKKTAIALSLSVAMLASPMLASAEPLTFGEQQTIRSMASAGVGQAIVNQMGAESMVVINNPSAICGALAGGLGAAMLSADLQAGFRIATMRSGNDGAAAAQVTADKDVAYLALGGELDRDENVALAHAYLKELAASEWDGTLVLHISSWMQKQVQAVAEADEAVADYLQGLNMVALQPDLDAGQAVMLRVNFDGEGFTTEEMGRQDMREDLVELFRRM